MSPRVRWWNSTTASKPTSTNIVKVAWGKRYWPHLRIHYLSRGRPRGHYWYPTDRVPLCTRLKLSSHNTRPCLPAQEGSGFSTCPMAPDTASRHVTALTSPRVPRPQTRLPAWEGSDVATCPMAPDPASRCERALMSPLVPWH
jgi:hypothetical protein